MYYSPATQGKGDLYLCQMDPVLFKSVINLDLAKNLSVLYKDPRPRVLQDLYWLHSLSLEAVERYPWSNSN